MTASTSSKIAATKKNRWTLNTVWYLFLPTMEASVRDGIIRAVVTRDYFKKLISKICNKAGIKREDLGIIAGVRAELYFDGTWTSVSFDAIEELAGKGTDIVFIEKEGVPEVLTEYADKYGIAMVNTRGYLTEYGKDLMTAAKISGANVAIMTDYDLTGINIASLSPKNMPWIGIDEATIEYFGLNRDSLTADATNMKLVKTVKKKVEDDERFKNVNIEFLKEKRVEIDAILAQVGDERFWGYIMSRLKEIFPTRDYNRAVILPERYSKEKADLLPKATKKLVRYITDLTEDGTEETVATIKISQEKVEGFLDVQEQKKKNMKQLTEELAQYEDMKKLDDKISHIWKLPEFISISQHYEHDEDAEGNNTENSASRKKDRK